MAALVQGHDHRYYSTDKYNRCYEAVYALLSEIESGEAD